MAAGLMLGSAASWSEAKPSQGLRGPLAPEASAIQPDTNRWGNFER